MSKSLSNIDKQAYRADGGDIGTGRLREIADNPYGDEEKFWLAKRVLTLLDELEAKDRRITEQAAVIAKQEKWIKDVEATMIAATDRAEAAEKRIAELERDETQLIEERDSAEKALADMYEAAMGERPEWSNLFGYAEAIDDVAQHINFLDLAAVTGKGE